jgi:hypothetical protein
LVEVTLEVGIATEIDDDDDNKDRTGQDLTRRDKTHDDKEDGGSKRR